MVNALQEWIDLARADFGDRHESQSGNATAVLNRAGVRIMRRQDGTFEIGLWRDADVATVRAALVAVKMDSLPVRYLDEPDILARYKMRAGVSQ